MIRVTRLSADAGDRRLVSDMSFAVPSGGVLALVGPSGSGKTTVGRALLGEAGPGVHLTGHVEIGGRRVSPQQPPPGGTVGYVPQQPAAALNPVRRIGSVLHEIARRHITPGSGRQEAREAVAAVLARVGLSDDPAVLRRYPHQLSGGQQQRLVIAHTLLAGARVLVADEPTTGQDNLNRHDIGGELRRLADAGVTVVLLSHDLHLVAAVADDALVLDRGTVARSGPPAHVLHAHLSPAATADRTDRDGPDRTAGAGSGTLPVLRAGGLTAAYRSTTVLHGVDLSLAAGRCLAVVGRSGSGKTTLARCLAGLHPPVRGAIALDGRPLAATVERRSRADLAAVQYVFQNPAASFHPYRPLLDQVARPGVRLHDLSTGEARHAAQVLLRRVGLTAEHMDRRPDRLSGGEQQRAALARALLARPRLLICDEITSGLDAAAQDRILTLLDGLRRAHHLTLLVITHDPDVVARLADRVVVLDQGRVIEHGPASTLLTDGRQPLTRALLVAHAQPGTDETRPR